MGRRGVCATKEGIRLLEEARVTYRNEKSDVNEKNASLSYEKLADHAGLSVKTVRRLFQGTTVDKQTVIQVVQALNQGIQETLDWENLVHKAIKDVEEQSGGNSERANRLIESLQDALSTLKKEEQTKSIAKEWLKGNRHVLSRDSAQSALEILYEKKITDFDETQLQEVTDLVKEIKIYLKFIYYCLDVSRRDFFYAAMQSAHPPVTRDARVYVNALKFIRNQRIKKDLLPEERKSILICIDYLIGAISMEING